MPSPLKKLIIDSSSDDESLAELEVELGHLYKDFKASTGTTQAVDIIQGGVKSNALPELVHAIVNHRIADYRSILPACVSTFRISFLMSVIQLGGGARGEICGHRCAYCRSLQPIS